MPSCAPAPAVSLLEDPQAQRHSDAKERPLFDRILYATDASPRRGSRIVGDSIQSFCTDLIVARALSETTSSSVFPHRMGRNYLNGRDGDRITEVIAVAGSTPARCCAG